jgi:hypothetical protein
MANQNNVSLIGQYWNTSTKSNNDGQMSVLKIGRHFRKMKRTEYKNNRILILLAMNVVL